MDKGSYKLKDGSIILEISDSGHGMDAEFIEKVFNPFQSSKMTGGSGAYHKLKGGP